MRPLIRNLIKSVFELRMSTGIEALRLPVDVIEALPLPVDVRRSKTVLLKLRMRFEPRKVKERCLWARQLLTARYNYALKLSCCLFGHKLIAGCLILIV